MKLHAAGGCEPWRLWSGSHPSSRETIKLGSVSIVRFSDYTNRRMNEIVSDLLSPWMWRDNNLIIIRSTPVFAFVMVYFFNDR